ncbi:MAG: ABC transporter permease [Candidatus Bathyarchaeota archaeon]|nr:ABC transporter permease [Candidatus Bathyarchaeota archaeon]
MVDFLHAIGYILLIFVASVGIGMLIGTFIKHMHRAIMTGVGLTVISATISGVMTPYAYLPQVLQQFARVYPVSSANSSIVYLFVGKDFAGYSLLSTTQTTLSVIISASLFVVGLISYSKFCWRKE